MDNDFYWIGDAKLGLVKAWNNGWSGEFIKPNGPGTKNVFDLDCGGSNVWVASGGHESNWSKRYMTDGVFSSNDGNWTTHNRSNTPAFDTVTDFITVKVDPNNPDIAYIGTWGNGVLQFVNNELSTIFDKQNSSLQPWISAQNLTLAGGLDFDSDHNLWVANSGAGNLISVMKNNGEWLSYNLGGALSGTDVTDLMVDDYNQKWIIKRADGFVIVFNDNNTLDDPSDDQAKVLRSTTGLGHIPGNKVYSFATDLDGEVWIGSDKGVSVFYSPENIFVPGANYDAQQILVPRNDGSGLADILLETELVTAISVDGANRKWIGTERTGVFLISPDGLEEIYHFTAENSPLLSNQIISIGIDQQGEVYIGTANGLISYRGSATPPNLPGSKVYAYPNPVREDYHGDIAIKGLVSDSFIKITDSYGNLVYQTKSEGGQAIWNGKNFDGHDVATGIYMVFAFTVDKSEKVVTKILVIR
jgi:frataxin-like iron-binding protein CyaY